jgi:XTP/dITP diphosphohydrolase
VVAVDRLLIVTSSPRLPAGLLSWPAWEALRSAPVHALDPTGSQAGAVRAAGVDVQEAPGAGDAAAFRELARGGHTAVWLAGPDGDPEFAAALADLVAATLMPSWRRWPAPGIRQAPGCSMSSR